ncbi:hypothetical protein [Leptotrichia sp. OH3620_COT-345]|uniref:hypothetical protein n=1 Tax=Leptotrichia sp. OH3620_COT-345 TaxID=2491048 RepID=UPI001F2C1AED|nr:hypothetical protein [Leptotrichia sp. OH3620_COT-345]
MKFLEEKTNNEIGYTSLNRSQIQDKMGINDDEKFKTAFKELVQENKIFFHQSVEAKINYDGSVFEMPKMKYFIDKNKAVDYKNKYEEKEAEILARREEIEKVKEDKLNTLSDNAKLIYSTYKENLGELVYLDSKTVRKASKLNFKDFLEAQKELTVNKVLFTTKISKEKDNEEKFILIDRGDILNKVLKREEVKQHIKENKEKENSDWENEAETEEKER